MKPETDTYAYTRPDFKIIRCKICNKLLMNNARTLKTHKCAKDKRLWENY